MKSAALGIDPAGKGWARRAFYRPGHERTLSRFAPIGDAGSRRTLAGPVCFSGLAIQVHHAIEPALPLWQAFEAEAAGTFYQSSLWCRAWVDTVGLDLKVAPRIVVGRDNAGQVRFILPLQIRRRQGVDVLEFLCSPHNGYGYGLYHKDFLPSAAAWFEDHWADVLALAGRFDAVALDQLPDRLLGSGHPLTGQFNVKGANPSFTTALGVDFEALHKRKRDGEDRRVVRKKEAALAQLGPVSFGVPHGKADFHATLDLMFEQQKGRLAERGVHGVFGPRERRFLHRIADLQDDDRPVLAPYRLVCGDEVLAIMLGGVFGGGYWALISSLAAGASRKHSPGDLALRRTIAACCATGLDFIDFSAGDSTYKRAWADETIQLHNVHRAVTLRGLAWTIPIVAGLGIKRFIKSSPVLMPVMAELRRMACGKPALTR